MLGERRNAGGCLLLRGRARELDVEEREGERGVGVPEFLAGMGRLPRGESGIGIGRTGCEEERTGAKGALGTDFMRGESRGSRGE